MAAIYIPIVADELSLRLAASGDERVLQRAIESHYRAAAAPGLRRRYRHPATLGRALSPKIGVFFNSVLFLKRSGTNASAKREFFTSPQGVVEVKNSAPFSVKTSYPIETGLADFFRDVRGEKAAPKPAIAAVK